VAVNYGINGIGRNLCQGHPGGRKYTFVLYDRETGSLWYPYEDGLMGIQGIYFKRRLPKLQSEDTNWQNWKKKHPQSRIMK
jgi:hypothetical protein